ncbi:serine/threonine protein kinase [Phormidium tenue]|uniref:Serine/threonine protein kinase n=1 Tax=Phormidium tenue NIES-30 TaxID=549789 RepID=A0A1U7J9A1_9CYAN|nr:serine/threonine protein kinase [Phormidium tenue]MBD2230915.1 serine/threonine protein kinase [Phormidium tenue FACHB-1052]OKH50044.1 serine/threonine protein kinase [Phormidium tenue NIES-30]
MLDPIQALVNRVREELLPNLHLESIDPCDPVVVRRLPAPWSCLGTGNYAAVFAHPDHPNQVVKVYAPGRPGIEAEVDVYRRLGEHPAFSQCYFSETPFLILRRLPGVNLYDSLHRGLDIPPQVIRDIDAALAYARQRGLFPHDVHGRNVMQHEGRGVVVDVSDFLNLAPDRAWQDVKRAYWWIYRPFFRPLGLRMPYFMLDWVRVGYRLFRRLIGVGLR